MCSWAQRLLTGEQTCDVSLQLQPAHQGCAPVSVALARPHPHSRQKLPPCTPLSFPAVREVRRLLDSLPEECEERRVENVTRVPRDRSRVDDYRVESSERGPGGARFVIRGEALERFTQMTTFEYFEGLLRFQRRGAGHKMPGHCCRAAASRFQLL